jgi:fructokinase
MSSVWVAGEALIDLIPLNFGSEDRLAIVGGGPANTAKALARLGIDTYFIDGISTDSYGKAIRKELEADGVHLDYTLKSKLPTCTATVTLDAHGSASYEFLIAGTATFEFDEKWLPNPANPPSVVHVGTLATIVEPGATKLFDWMKKIKAPLVFDPNIRPSVISDRAQYRAVVDKWATISSVIKVSDEDLEWLYPKTSMIDAAEAWLSHGVGLVVVTLGSEGLVGFTQAGEVRVPGVKVEVSDTVGAGDTVGAIIVEGLIEHGLLQLRGETLKKVLTRAAKAASITVSRPGANPPTHDELIGF